MAVARPASIPQGHTSQDENVSMKGMIRTLLIDPREETRGELQGLLAGIGKLRLCESCSQT